MFEELRQIVASILDVSPNDISPLSGPVDIASWDSLAHIAIVTSIEETYGIEFTMHQILSMKSISAIETAVTDSLQRQQTDA